MEIDRAKRRLRLRDLETLAAVVQFGGMRKAAEVLHLSQPAISKAIAELEQELGVRLLERGRRGAVATASGEALVRRSRIVFDELQGALREIADLGDPDSGEVRLGCMETLHAGLVSATVARTVRRYPKMRIVLETGQAPALLDHFLRGRLVDFVVARHVTPRLPPDLEGESLFHDHLKVVVGATHPLARRRRLALAELADERWILGGNETLADGPVGIAFAAAGAVFPPRRLVVSGSLHTRYTLLRTGTFVTVVPHSLLPFGGHQAAFRVLPVVLPPWHSPTMIMRLRGRTLGPAAERFLETLRELARPLDIDRPGPDPTHGAARARGRD